jgi:hypothetical protein
MMTQEIQILGCLLEEIKSVTVNKIAISIQLLLYVYADSAISSQKIDNQRNVHPYM